MNKQEGAIKAGFVYDLPELTTSVEEVSLRVQEGGSRKASFAVAAGDGSKIKGRVMSDSARITFEDDSFEGKEVQVVFTISAKGLKAGQMIRTEILIRSNLSETLLPVNVEITDLPIRSGERSLTDRMEITDLGENETEQEVRTLDEFSRLCQKNMREGFRLFTGENFAGILNGNNRQYMALYRGMSRNPVTYQHLEEFLVSTGKKKPIELSLDKQDKAVYHLDVSQKDTLYVYRNTWGYVRLEVEVEGDFLEVEKRVITTDDFIGKVYGLEYVVHREKIGEGKSFGKIRIRSVHQTLEYSVEATAREESEIRLSAVRSRRISWLMRDFLNLQMHILDYPSWAESGAMTVAEMLEEDPADPWAILYHAYLEYSRDDNAKVMEILWPVKDGTVRLQSEEQKGVYLYLAKAVGLLPEEHKEIIMTLRRYYMRNPKSYLLLKLVHQEEDPDTIVSADRMQEYEDCFRAGCMSPFLYLDAWELLSKEESLLRRLSPFMLQMLCFGDKHGYITEGLLQRAAFLSDNQKRFRRPLYRVLTNGYEKFPNDDVLEAICKLIIKGDPVRPEYSIWYARAVEHDIRVTRLYEYFMETYHEPAEEELPLPIRMYFATNNTLGEKKRALLYASIVCHKKEDETSYLNYAKTMKAFTRDALMRGRIDKNYAILYAEFCRKPASPEEALALADVLFAREVHVADPAIRTVIVSHTALKDEVTASVRDGVAYPRVFTDDACILLEDVHHRRYATTIPYSVSKLMDERDYARHCLDLGIDHAGAELNLCREKTYLMEVNTATLAAYRQAVRNDAFTDEYRNTLRRKLLDYDMEHPEENLLPDALPKAELEDYATADKVNTLTLLIREGRYEDACEIAETFGTEGVESALLEKMASRIIGEGNAENFPGLTAICWKVFDKGHYDDVILTYLREQYDGPVRNLCRLWKMLMEHQIETRSLEEKILLTSIQTHQFPDFEMDILRNYIRQQGRTEVISAFLCYEADYYFLGDRQTQGQLFIMMEGQIQRGELDYTVCKLALLKYYAEIGTLNNARMDMCRQLLLEMDRKGYRFEFYNYLPDSLIQAHQIEDKVFIEEQYSPDSHVVLHYKLTEKDGEEGEWISEPMRNVYYGIFVKEFLLFYGETLTYYLTVTKGEEKTNTDSYQVSLVDMDTSGNTKYRMLNRMLEARDNQDRQTFSQTLEQYLSQEAYVEKFLKLVP